MSLATVEQLHSFHAKDREIFWKLVKKFSRPPAESLLIMATWFWLQDIGFENIFSIIMALPDPFLSAMADEAVSCFECLSSDEPPKSFNQIPLTAKLMKKHISLQLLYKYRYSGIAGIKNLLRAVCSRIFSDILQQVLPSSSNLPFPSSFMITRPRQPLIIPGFPHSTFGSINVMRDVDNNLPRNNLYLFPNGVWGWNSNYATTLNERTLFLTFSRGFSVSREEVKELFTEYYGENCVEALYMQGHNSPNKDITQQQPLYATLLMDSIATVDLVLKGEKKQKLHINNKHVWARKYEEREAQGNNTKYT